TSFYTTNELTDGDISTEDWTQDEPDPDSLWASLDGLTPQDLCDEELTSDQCDAVLLLIMVSAEDNTIKQQTSVFYREKVTDRGGCGTYAKNGYRSRVHMRRSDSQ